MREKILSNLQTFFVIIKQEKMLTDKATIRSCNRGWEREA